MIHRNRVFRLAAIETAEELAEKLAEMTWTLCTAFELSGLVFLNDAFSEDGVQEYVVVRGGREIKSVTFSWCTREAALQHIEGFLAGGGGDYGGIEPRFDDPTGPCPRCA